VGLTDGYADISQLAASMQTTNETAWNRHPAIEHLGFFRQMNPAPLLTGAESTFRGPYYPSGNEPDTIFRFG
jgi:hypothetical protein